MFKPRILLSQPDGRVFFFRHLMALAIAHPEVRVLFR